MADNLSFQTPRNVETLDILGRYSTKQIRSVILDSNEPLKLPKASADWPCSRWTPVYLANQLGSLQTSFRICAKMDSPFYKFTRSKVIMETDCLYVNATLINYCAWLGSDFANAGELAQYPRAHFWCYADYKHMAEIFKDVTALRRAPNWGKLGFPEITGDQSTIWIGSDGCSTPCHLDTYGCNLVAQIFGKKRWCLFPPSETSKLYPTRIPYEESSIFSQVNIKYPDFNMTPRYYTATRYEVILEPGDVLLVPRHWWHFVESLEPSISINTWITLESDHIDRVREAITRTLVCSMKTSEGNNPQNWLTSAEKTGSHKQHLEYLQNAVNVVIAHEGQSGAQGTTTNFDITNNDIIDCITSPQIVSTIADELLQKARLKDSNCRNDFADTSTARCTSSQKQPTQSSCNCKCCISESIRHGMMTRNSKRTLGQDSRVCYPCCKHSPNKKKKKP